MFGKFMKKRLLVLVTAIVVVSALTEDETIRDWRKFVETGRIVEPELKQRTSEPGI